MKRRAISDSQRTEIIKSLKAPRSAAIAGILFALLYGSALALIRVSIPADIQADNAWLETNADKVSLALNLVPFSGIAFLWFIGVIRDRLGALEDRFFATVFLGSGLLFLAMTFAGAALAGGLLKAYASQPSILTDGGLYTYSRAVMYDIVNIYAIRMAGVFMISLATIWMRTGLMHRAWALATYALALILLLSVGYFQLVTFVFPAWVLAVSSYFLIMNLRGQVTERASDI